MAEKEYKFEDLPEFDEKDAPHRGDVFLCGLLAIVNIIVGLVPFALLPM